MADTPKDDELVATEDPTGYVAPKEVGMEELANLDAEDESLRKWKESLGIGVGAAVKKEPVKITFLFVDVIFEESDREPLRFPLDTMEGESPLKENVEKMAKQPFDLKEKSKYHLEVSFRVENDIMFGLKYLHVVHKGPMRVDKEEQMIGSYPPKEEPHVFKFPTQETPSGFVARGRYTAKAKFIDDYQKELLSFKYTFKIVK